MKKFISMMVFCLFFISAPVTTFSATPVKIGVLPIVDALPFYVAQQHGLFKALPRPVTLVTFRSAVERDAAFQTGKVDAYLGDLISATLLRSRGFPAKVVSIILGKRPSEGLFAILTPPTSPIRNIRDLEGKHIAISSNTIIEYVLDGLLKAHGIPPGTVKKQEIKSIPIRFQMLMTGKIDAAVLPDPLASLARSKGAHWIADDGKYNLSQTVLVWNDAFIHENTGFLKTFYKAYNRAVAIINRDHEAVRGLLVEKCRLPRSIASSFKFADFPSASIPSRASVESVLSWVKGKGLLKRPVTFEDLCYAGDLFPRQP